MSNSSGSWDIHRSLSSIVGALEPDESESPVKPKDQTGTPGELQD